MITADDFADYRTEFDHNFSIVTLNIESINQKFNSLCILLEILEKSNMYFSAICLQETWPGDNKTVLDQLTLENYEIFALKATCTSNGGRHNRYS